MKEVNEVEMQELSLTISHDSAKASRQHRLSRLIAAADWRWHPHLSRTILFTSPAPSILRLNDLRGPLHFLLQNILR